MIDKRYIGYLCAFSGPCAVEESQEECVTGPDKERGGEEDDGATIEQRGNHTEAEEH